MSSVLYSLGVVNGMLEELVCFVSFSVSILALITCPVQFTQCILCTMLCTILHTMLCTVQYAMLRTKIRAKQSLHYIYIQISVGFGSEFEN